MDLKGLQWLGNVYNKFEAMCVEMEEAMYQDTVKYVENQVHTVNQNVKRFCGEVVKDLHKDLYIDPDRVADMKKIASAKKELTDTCEKLDDDSRVLISGKYKSGVYKRLTARKKGHSSTDHSTITYELGPTFSGNLSSIPVISRDRGSDEVVSSKVRGPTCRVIQVAQEPIEKNVNPIMDAEVVGPKETNLGPTLSTSAGEEDTCVANKAVSLSFQNDVVDAATNSASQNDVVDADTDTNSGKCVEEISCFAERLKDYTEDVANNFDITDPPDMELIEQIHDDSANGSYVSDHDMEFIEQYDDSSLADTCVLVEKDNLLFPSQRDSIRKSYKKKLKEAFSGKKRSTRKEYEQLMLNYKDQNFSKEDENPKISHPYTCSEPEWELL